MMLRHFGTLLLSAVLLATPVSFASAEDAPAPDARAATGGAQTLEDILARQRGQAIDDSFRSEAIGNPDAVGTTGGPLGTRGGQSDSEIYRSIRYNSADVRVSNSGPASDVLIQDSGMTWLNFRGGPLRTYGGYALVAMLVLLGLFYGLRGKVMIDGGPAGRTITRFKAIERFGHWLLAGSFLLLGATGLISLFGRVGLIPLLGHDGYSALAIGSKWVHNNVSWAFMIALIMVFVMWVAHNIPAKRDLIWLAKGGGLFSKHSHPSAKKFNAGQKIIFWGVIVMGASISVSGLSLLFPFELPMFAKTFGHLNDLGISALLGLGELPTTMPPHEEMQLAQAWHSIMAFAMLVMILAHIYIGSVGMEGAFDAMSSGEVDLEWARQHHDLWVEEVQAKEGGSKSAPAE